MIHKKNCVVRKTFYVQPCDQSSVEMDFHMADSMTPCSVTDKTRFGIARKLQDFS